MEHQHEDQVQHDVDTGAEHQEVQGTAAVANGTEDTGAHIVQHQTGNTAEVDLQIGLGLHKHILRSFHQGQHDGGQENAHHRADEADDQGKRNGGVHRLVDAFGVFGAKALGDDHTGTHRHTGEEAHQHIDDGGSGTHRRQRLFADELAHHDGVHGIIKLLEQIADHQRQGKSQQMLPDDTLGHVTGLFTRRCHGTSPLSVVSLTPQPFYSFFRGLATLSVKVRFMGHIRRYAILRKKNKEGIP